MSLIYTSTSSLCPLPCTRRTAHGLNHTQRTASVNALAAEEDEDKTKPCCWSDSAAVSNTPRSFDSESRVSYFDRWPLVALSPLAPRPPSEGVLWTTCHLTEPVSQTSVRNQPAVTDQPGPPAASVALPVEAASPRSSALLCAHSTAHHRLNSHTTSLLIPSIA